MLPPPEELKTALESLLPGVAITIEGSVLVVQPKDLTAVCRCLKEHERFDLDYLANLTAVDYPAEHLPAEALLRRSEAPASQRRASA